MLPVFLLGELKLFDNCPSYWTSYVVIWFLSPIFRFYNFSLPFVLTLCLAYRPIAIHILITNVLTLFATNDSTQSWKPEVSL